LDDLGGAVWAKLWTASETAAIVIVNTGLGFTGMIIRKTSNCLRVLKISALTALMCAFAWGADITGTWTGTIAVDDAGSGTTITTQIHVDLQQQGTGVSGKIGRVEDAEAVPIKNAKMEGDTLSFEAASDETSGPMKFSLKIAGDRMEGTMKGSIDSGNINGKVKLTREKASASR
jgi:hypothetical protein